MPRSCLAVASALLATACNSGNAPLGPDASVDAGPPPGPVSVQLNDVSLVFPLASGAHASDYLAASATTTHGPLLPQVLYDQIGHITGSSGNPAPGGTGEALYSNLHVVAMRLDPCFAALAPDPHGAGCTAQLRLVVQEITDTSDGPIAFDSALHVFYGLSRDDVYAMAGAISALRAANSDGGRLGALAPHPIMVSQGMSGAMAKGVEQLILQYAGADRLTRVTELSSSNTDSNWAFSGFDVTGGGAASPTTTPMVIPTLGAGVTSQTFFDDFAPSLTGDGGFVPSTMGSDDMTLLASQSQAEQATAAARATAFAALVRVDQPADNSPNTIDCASCHLATPASEIVAQGVYGLDETSAPGAFVPDGTDVLPSEMAITFDPGEESFNLHAFSYSGTQVAINRRVVNETAAIVAYLNANAP